MYKVYTIYYKSIGDWKVIDALPSGEYNINEGDFNATYQDAKKIDYGVKKSRSGERLDTIYSSKINNIEATKSNDGLFENNQKQNGRTQQIDFKDNRNQELENSFFSLETPTWQEINY